MARNAFETARQKPEPGKPIVWTLAPEEKDAEALAHYVRTKNAFAALATTLEQAETPLKASALKRYLEQLGTTGSKPGPVRMTNGAETIGVTIAERRSPIADKEAGLTEADAEAEIAAVFAKLESAPRVVEQTRTIAFNADVLTETTSKGETVYDWLGKRLGNMLADAVIAKTITSDQADRLLAASCVTTAKPGWIETALRAFQPLTKAQRVKRLTRLFQLLRPTIGFRSA